MRSREADGASATAARGAGADFALSARGRTLAAGSRVTSIRGAISRGVASVAVLLATTLDVGNGEDGGGAGGVPTVPAAGSATVGAGVGAGGGDPGNAAAGLPGCSSGGAALTACDGGIVPDGAAPGVGGAFSCGRVAACRTKIPGWAICR